MDEAGSPKTADKRVEHAGNIFAKILEYGMEPEQLFLDPIIMPVKYMQEQASEILNAASQFRLFSDPPCHIVGGLSNISNGLDGGIQEVVFWSADQSSNRTAIETNIMTYYSIP